MTLRSMLLAMATLGSADPGYMVTSDEFGRLERPIVLQHPFPTSLSTAST
ncbi:hypothetical protein ACFPLB_01845 [Aquamicrobium segne]|uniref:Uncharacterized protein n=1 Tax=Aquamicrobium segne TaxID=469547 RepID=A0ABW0GTW4_9HYPH